VAALSGNIGGGIAPHCAAQGRGAEVARLAIEAETVSEGEAELRAGPTRHRSREVVPELRAKAVDDVLSGRKSIARVAQAYGVRPSTIGRLVQAWYARD